MDIDCNEQIVMRNTENYLTQSPHIHCLVIKNVHLSNKFQCFYLIVKCKEEA